MIIKNEITIDKNIKQAWKLLGFEFTEIGKWASSVSHSEGSGEAFGEAECVLRGCESSLGSTKDKLTSYSNKDYALSYVIFEGLPKMINFAENHWSLHSSDSEKTKLEIKMDIQITSLMGFIIKPMMRMKMSKMGKELTEEFKYYLEKGQPHPRKLKSLNS